MSFTHSTAVVPNFVDMGVYLIPINEGWFDVEDVASTRQFNYLQDNFLSTQIIDALELT